MIISQPFYLVFICYYFSVGKNNFHFICYLVRGRINGFGDVVQNKAISDVVAVGIDDSFLDNLSDKYQSKTSMHCVNLRLRVCRIMPMFGDNRQIRQVKFGSFNQVIVVEIVFQKVYNKYTNSLL